MPATTSRSRGVEAEADDQARRRPSPRSTRRWWRRRRACARRARPSGAIGSERKRSIRPFLRSSARPSGRDEAAEGDRLDDDARDEEVHVVVARRLDRAAEDVDEQQHEHDRLDREADQQVGLARDAQQVALARGPACRRPRSPGRSRRAPPFSSSSARSAAWPVRARKTSSSVGRRSATSSICDARLVEPAHRLGDRAPRARAARPRIAPSSHRRRLRRPSAPAPPSAASASRRSPRARPRAARRRRGP